MLIDKKKTIININKPLETYFLIDETTEDGRKLAQKINYNYPYFELVTEARQIPIMEEQINDDGEIELVESGEYKEVEFVIDVIVLEEEIIAEQERLEQDRLEQELLDSLKPTEREVLFAEIELNTINLLLDLEVI